MQKIDDTNPIILLKIIENGLIKEHKLIFSSKRQHLPFHLHLLINIVIFKDDCPVNRFFIIPFLHPFPSIASPFLPHPLLTRY